MRLPAIVNLNGFKPSFTRAPVALPEAAQAAWCNGVTAIDRNQTRDGAADYAESSIRSRQYAATAMQTPLRLAFRHLPRSDALEARIRERAAKLEEFFARITGCRVVVQELDRHRRQGRQFCVRVDVREPKREIVVSRHHDEDAFDAAARQLKNHARLKRGGVRTHKAP